MKDDTQAHLCLGVDQCESCRRESEFWNRYAEQEALAQEREAS